MFGGRHLEGRKFIDLFAVLFCCFFSCFLLFRLWRLLHIFCTHMQTQIHVARKYGSPIANRPNFQWPKCPLSDESKYKVQDMLVPQAQYIFWRFLVILDKMCAHLASRTLATSNTDKHLCTEIFSKCASASQNKI